MFVTKFDTLTGARRTPMECITHDWFGEEVLATTSYGFAIDPDCLHFRARRAAPACIHPAAAPGLFMENLWQHDAAEFFIVHPDGGRYLEFNLAPNGAWWSCEFTAPRHPLSPAVGPFPDVITTGRVADDAWEATASLPLAILRERLHFGPNSRLNATFTLKAPDPVFLTAAPLGPGQPDFHQPGRLPRIRIQPS